MVVTPEADGMASLWALLTAPQAVGAFTWLTRLARALGPDDPRSTDARRAVILAALLTGRPVAADIADSTTIFADSHKPTAASPARATRQRRSELAARIRRHAARRSPTCPVQPVAPGKPLIQVVILYSTLTGADDQPCELVVHRPIPAEPGP